ncbi:hypothetical protein OAO01_08380, partial [Oligoflexia bacterium]|nr:hypothetical protein [Oligoflexia bacterium]
SPIEFFPAAGTNIYEIDTSGSSWRTDTLINKINLNLIGSAGVNWSLHWVALRKNGCSSESHSPDTKPTISSSPGNLVNNVPPIFSFIQPDKKGGADFAATVLGDPWNMDTATDIKSVTNITGARFYLDFEKFDRHGDFFCAANEGGNDDPYQTSFSDLNSVGTLIDATRFKNTTVTFYVDAEQDVVNGSVLRLIGLNRARDDLSYTNGNDTFYGGKEWDTVIQDMDNWNLEEVIHPNPPADPWDGQMNEFRADIHEFTPSTNFCIDRIELRADHESDSVYTIAYNLTDSDSGVGDVSVSFYYSTTAGATSGGTAIEEGVSLSAQTHLVDFDTSGLSNGKYYVYAVATDGLNEIKKAAPGVIVVNHSLSQDSAGPTLSLDYPKAGQNVYKTTGLPVIGWALDNIKLALIEVFIDSQLADTFEAGEYHKEAHDTFPSFADASNAGFEQFVTLNTTGSITVRVKACDTAGNCTEKEIDVTVVSGSDPNPPSLPASQGGTTLPVGETELTLTQSLTSEGLLTLTVANADVTCLGGKVSILGHVAKAKLRKNKKTTELASFTATAQDATVSFQASVPRIKGGKNKKTGKKKKPNVHLGVLCEASPGTIDPVTVKGSKKVVKSPQTKKKQLKTKAWLKYVALVLAKI